MTSIVVEPKDEKDLLLLENLLNRLGVQYHLDNPGVIKKNNDLNGSGFWDRIKTGVAKGAFPDPVIWQRETRADRDLPGREE